MSWAEDFFDDHFAELFLKNHSNTESDIKFIKSVGRIKEGAYVFDQGCGIGRLSHKISKLGATVIGVDIVKDYIQRAQENCPKGIFKCANAETFISDQKCDLALNWWTSFGYGKTHKDDLRVLECAYQSLKPGGYYLLEIPNAEYCRRQYAHDHPLIHESRIDDVKIKWEGWLSENQEKIFKRWSFEKPDGETGTKTGGGIRLYTVGEIKAMLTQCGFKVVHFYGSVDHSAFDKDSQRCIVVAQKPERKFFQADMPETASRFRQSIYNGDVYKISSNKVSHALIDHIRNDIEKIFGSKAQHIHTLGPHEKSLAKLAPLKSDLKSNTEYHIIIRALLMELGLTPSEYAIDYPRLRVNLPAGYKNKNAKLAYSAHRDTWYCNPQSQINFWIPLYACSSKQTFAFYPDYFNAPVKNNSDAFDYEKWTSGGYPETKEELSNPVSFKCEAGEIILFSGAHLHKGLEHNEDTTRYSLDFRIVNIQDFEKGIGAPNTDNKSRPFAMPDYLGSGI